MVADTKPTSTANHNRNGGGKGKKRKYLPHGRPVKKGAYPLRPGVEGFFLTCDGGRERQATNEALNLLDTFYEELVDGEDSSKRKSDISNKPLNKIIKFEDSDSSDEDEDGPHEDTTRTEEDSADTLKQKEDIAHPVKDEIVAEKHEEETQESLSKKQRVEIHTSNTETFGVVKTDDKPIDQLIEDELKELGDRNKRRFVSLDAGCNGVAFIQMHRKAKIPGPAEIAKQMMTSAASSRKHMSRFILRLLPVEVTCYASEEEILKAIKPLIDQHFPTEAPTPRKFAVLYEARANTGIDRMKIINAVAKSVPPPHKVDLSSPEKTIIVQIAKTICMVGIVEKYKELSKYNLRQLTSPQK